MELRDLYDENRNLLDEVVCKGEKIPEGKYFVVVVVWIENSKGEVLIQKRALSKGGRWATTGGHPITGQTTFEGIICEIKEEIGLDVTKAELTLFSTIKYDDCFVDLYYIKKDVDISLLKLQEEEVSAVKWASKEEIENLITNGDFFKPHLDLYAEYRKYLETGEMHPIKRQSCRGIIIENEEVILLYRRKHGKVYYSIPGGGIEKGESLEQTVIRELKEELNADAKVICYLGKNETKSTIYHYFKCSKTNDNLEIIGPEKNRICEDNYYEIRRVKLTDIEKLPVLAKEKILAASSIK